MTNSKWIQFVKDESSKNKTGVYWVMTKDPSPTHLGTIKWFGAWRKYAFFPANYTIYETQCLKDIIIFLENMMVDRKIAKQQIEQQQLLHT